MEKNKKIILGVNVALILAVFVGNYFYHTVGGLLIKTLCSGGFALIGLLNLAYAELTEKEKNFPVSMAIGLFLAMLGDVAINLNFVIGAALFALGHVCYFVSYCLLAKLKKTDLFVCGGIFLCTALFLLLCPLLDFGDAVKKVVCFVYALIISLMAGKAIANFFRRRDLLTLVLLVGSILFFFSDLMLLFNMFMGAGKWASTLCMATYYPAECSLAFSSLVCVAFSGTEKAEK